jgi:hypothetical protein
LSELSEGEYDLLIIRRKQTSRWRKLMRRFSILLAALVMIPSVPAAFAATASPTAHKGMSKADAFKACEQQRFNRAQQMRECVGRKMRGEE